MKRLPIIGGFVFGIVPVFAAQKWETGVSSVFQGAAMHDSTLGTILIIVLAVLTVGFLIFAFTNYYNSTSGDEKTLQRYVKKIAQEKMEILCSAAELYLQHRETEIPGIFLSILRDAKKLSDIQLLIPFQYHENPAILCISSHADFESLKQPYFNHSFYRADHTAREWIQSAINGKVNGSLISKEINELHVLVPVEVNGKHFVIAFIRDLNA
jgi:hypothetical protein